MIFGKKTIKADENVQSTEITIAICKCSNRETYGMRLEKKNNKWEYTWAFPINAKAAQTEGFDCSVIEGPFIEGKEYPGCPYCKTKNFFRCGTCGHLNCWDGVKNRVTCKWCDNTSGISGTIQKLDTSNNI